MAPSLVQYIALWMLGFSLTTATLTSKQKEEILNAHNYYRGHVDPIATNMLKMEWDDDLAYIAQFWAANCHYSLNKYRSHQSSEFDYVGETIANTTNSYVNYTHLVYEWFQKGKRYNYYQGYCRSSDGTVDTYGHGCIPYRQLVWADTYKIGCGAVRCETLYNNKGSFAKSALLFVCNYGPGGDFIGIAPYESGKHVCSSCPSSTPYCVKKLCSRYSGDQESAAKDSPLLLLLQFFIFMLL